MTTVAMHNQYARASKASAAYVQPTMVRIGICWTTRTSLIQGDRVLHLRQRVRRQS
ncbi:hypothetical protein [Streptomyces massasporeus]|uniref:hypothetical protein n=1 Tax=Streptomyces massasporeus TaxID=67324 RepID=UPI0033D6E128